MATEKWVSRLEAKIDALLEKAGIHARDIDWGPEPATRQARELTAAQQQAIDNAPATPAAAPPATKGPRVTQENAPDTSSSVPTAPQGAVGSVTVETKEPDGGTKVDTKPASQAKEGETGKRKS